VTTTAPAQRTRETATRAADSSWTRALASIGLFARSTLYAVVAVLALQIAFGRNQEADSTGALHTLARQPLGRVLLALLAAGFLAYALWRLAEALVAHPGREHDAVKRLVDAGRVVIYLGLCAAAIGVIVGSRRVGSSNREQGWTARVLGWPGGRLLVAAVGIAVIVAGLLNLRHLFDGSWRENIDLSRRTEGQRKAITACAAAGLTARAAVFAAIGVFLLQAAIDYSTRTGVGLDGALHRLAHGAGGPYVLTAFAIGLLAYALYSTLEAVFRPTPRD
jgi:hypothetical protein